LGLVNKLIGAAFGFLKSALVLCLFVLILLKINANYFIISEEKLQASQIYPVLEDFSKALWNGLGNQKLFLPES
jgi:membrane protein required for colicin V production